MKEVGYVGHLQALNLLPSHCLGCGISENPRRGLWRRVNPILHVDFVKMKQAYTMYHGYSQIRFDDKEPVCGLSTIIHVITTFGQ